MSRTPAITPCSGAAGVVRTLMVERLPSCSSARSVKVPPISTASRAEGIQSSDRWVKAGSEPVRRDVASPVGQPVIARSEATRQSPSRCDNGDGDFFAPLTLNQAVVSTVKHFHEELRRRHGYLLGYTVTRLALQSAGLVTPAKRRASIGGSISAVRCQACCCSRACPTFQDGSTHRWIGAFGHYLDLIVTMDDRRTGSTRRSWWTRKARCRASSGCVRRLRRKGCLVRSTPIAARTTSSRRRPAVRWTRSI